MHSSVAVRLTTLWSINLRKSNLCSFLDGSQDGQGVAVGDANNRAVDVASLGFVRRAVFIRGTGLHRNNESESQYDELADVVA